MRTDVLLTVDLEFSSGHYFDDPVNNRPVGPHSIDLSIDGRSEGFGFMLDTIQRFDAVATFFVEAAHVLYFGYEPMADYVQQLQAADQDLQLHLHPQWLHWYGDTGDGPPMPGAVTDSVADLDADTLSTLFTIGFDAFERWRLPRPIAFRAGNLQIDRGAYAVMQRHGLTLGSNIGIGISPPGDASLHFRGGRHRIEEIVELPLLTYQGLRLGARGRSKTLTITGSSEAEMRHLLRSANAAGVEEVVVLTHAHEMIRRSDARYARISRNPTNQRRFERLCSFVADAPEQFRFTTFSERAEHWLRSQDTVDPELSVPNGKALLGMLENRISDFLGP